MVVPNTKLNLVANSLEILTQLSIKRKDTSHLGDNAVNSSHEIFCFVMLAILPVETIRQAVGSTEGNIQHLNR